MRLAAIVLLVTGLLAACGDRGAGSPDVVGSWQFADGTADGAALPRPAGAGATLEVTPGELRGRSFCNSFSAGYRQDGDSIALDGLGGTEMGCEPELMAAESAFLGALGRITTAARDGADLVLTGDGVRLRFTPVVPAPDRDLAGTRWVLDTLVDGRTASSTVSSAAPGTLELAPGGPVTGSTGCRGFVGTWETAGDVLTLVVDRDDVGCPDDLGRQDAHVLAVLDSGPRWTVAADRLTLTADDGRGLGYRAG
ncbi:META domain-containing protein [Blastococcus sp. SYSU D00820]